jgi:hypothetical protein
MTNFENRPRVVNDAMEYMIVSIQLGWSNNIDFARLDPKGELFLHRLLQDDGAPSQVRPGQAFDPILMTLVSPRQWLWVWLSPEAAYRLGQSPLTINEGGIVHDNAIETCAQFSRDTPLSALGQFVE